MWRVMLLDIKRFFGSAARRVKDAWLGFLLASVLVGFTAVVFSPTLIVAWFYPDFEGAALAMNVTAWLLFLWVVSARDRSP